MSQIVERVAKALWLTYWDGDPLPFEDADPSAQEMSRSLARAAIEAMREPSQVMIDAGACRTSVSARDNTLATWGAMIDAALKVQP